MRREAIPRRSPLPRRQVLLLRRLQEEHARLVPANLGQGPGGVLPREALRGK